MSGGPICKLRLRNPRRNQLHFFQCISLPRSYNKTYWSSQDAAGIPQCGKHDFEQHNSKLAVLSGAQYTIEAGCLVEAGCSQSDLNLSSWSPPTKYKILHTVINAKLILGHIIDTELAFGVKKLTRFLVLNKFSEPRNMFVKGVIAAKY